MADYYFVDETTGSSCYLIAGEKVIVIDPGMAFNGENIVEKIKALIGSRPVDTVLLTHSHYDHVGALPFIRNEWPEVTVCAHGRVAHVFEQPGALNTIRRLSEEAAKLNDTVIGGAFSEQALTVDVMLEDGEVLNYSDFKIRVIGCPGHTRDSLAFLLDDKVLFASETLGLPNHDGRYTPEFLFSWKESLESVRKCRSYPVRYLCLPHFGIYKDPEGRGMWQWMEDGLMEARDSMIGILKDIPDEESRLKAMEEKYWNRHRVGGIPKQSFYLNAQAMLKTIGEEFAGEINKKG